MMCDTFRRLTPFGRIDSYRYVGFGSFYFNDFTLFHRSLGINDMISIEGDADNEVRFRSNVPFKFIDIRFGWSDEILPSLDWTVRSIVWLDYDGVLDGRVLADVKTVLSKAEPGSFLAFSMNAQTKDFEDIEHNLNPLELKLRSLADAISDERIPIGITAKDMAGWGCAKVYFRILNNEINSVIQARNGTRRLGQRLKFKQVLYFHYEDGAKMVTLGGVLIDEGQEHLFAQASFNTLPFFSETDKAFHIKVPSLTFKEIRHLDMMMPDTEKNSAGIPPADMKEYAKIYRYFPNFTESDF